MVNKLMTLHEAERIGLVSIVQDARICESAQFVPCEDDGQSYGMTVIGEGAHIRAGAIICSGVEIGQNTVIGHQSVIRAGVNIGNDCVISHLVCIERDAQIGDHVRISALTHITGGCHIGNEVQIGARVVTINDNEMRWRHGEILCAPRILSKSKIGSGCTLLGHVTIGEGAFIGAGSVVTRDIAAHHLAYGNPAYVQGEAPSGEWRAGASSNG
ncbi:acyltransferase [Pseudomonas fluorescens]|uniref:acyltransferase n=1 Tax=Pseudomonas fluorescens TaxID=294 RepID=UPI000936EFCA|nr:acyltransferase [Pseudomonas fluorescens]